MRESDFLRLKADLLDSEEKASGMKPDKVECPECGRVKPMSEVDRKKFKKAMEPVRALREKVRQARESE